MSSSRFCIEREPGKERRSRPEHIRPKMSRLNRAKQFAPFAALGSMEQSLKETEEQMPGTDPQRIPEMPDFILRMLPAEEIDSSFQE